MEFAGVDAGHGIGAFVAGDMAGSWVKARTRRALIEVALLAAMYAFAWGLWKLGV